MADEALPVQGTKNENNLRIYTVAAIPAVPQYTLMFLSGDNTASFASSSSGAVFVGISVFEKSSGATVITVDEGGVWDLTASGGINRGVKVIMAGGNRVGDSAWGFQSSGALM